MMGSAYATAVLGIERPRVAVLSVGEERTKGNAQVLEAAQLLEKAPVHFIGNIEGKDMFHNVADVIVADGFVGNIVLKTGEGMIADLGKVIKETLLRRKFRHKDRRCDACAGAAGFASKIRLRDLWRRPVCSAYGETAS